MNDVNLMPHSHSLQGSRSEKLDSATGGASSHFQSRSTTLDIVSVLNVSYKHVVPFRITINLLVSIWLALNAFDGIQMSSDDSYVPPAHAVISLTNFDSPDDTRNHHWLPIGLGATVSHLSYDYALLATNLTETLLLNDKDSRPYLVNCAFLL
jgi:hypothetical protein